MINIEIANEIIMRPKMMVAGMKWIKKLNRGDGAWYQFDSAFHYQDDSLEVPEGLIIRGLWKPNIADRPSNYTFGLFVGSSHVYAIHVNPSGRHKNTIGKNRPFHGQTISGIHEHTWSSDGGYGYAEPLNGYDIGDIGKGWKMFAERTNLLQADFTPPEEARQGRLL
jgi:hypothetical protein